MQHPPIHTTKSDRLSCCPPANSNSHKKHPNTPLSLFSKLKLTRITGSTSKKRQKNTTLKIHPRTTPNKDQHSKPTKTINHLIFPATPDTRKPQFIGQTATKQLSSPRTHHQKNINARKTTTILFKNRSFTQN